MHGDAQTRDTGTETYVRIALVDVNGGAILVRSGSQSQRGLRGFEAATGRVGARGRGGRRRRGRAASAGRGAGAGSRRRALRDNGRHSRPLLALRRRRAALRGVRGLHHRGVDALDVPLLHPLRRLLGALDADVVRHVLPERGDESWRGEGSVSSGAREGSRKRRKRRSSSPRAPRLSP